MITKLTYYLISHPTIITFRWSSSQSYGATWSFLVQSITLYVTLTIAAHKLLPQSLRSAPTRAVGSVLNLAISLTSIVIFSGTLLSSAAEINEHRWLFGSRTMATTPTQWLVCFPPGIRPSGRVFFWSYAFYFSRLLHMARTPVAILSKGELSVFHVANNAVLVVVAFLWLEFSQSAQVVAILLSCAVNAVSYGYRFWCLMGVKKVGGSVVLGCRAAVLAGHVACHFAVLRQHFSRAAGCNGIGAWAVNAVLNGVILVMVLDFYWRGSGKRKAVEEK